MSELISVTILTGLAIWGYSCCRITAAHVRRTTSAKLPPRRLILAAMILVPVASSHPAMGQVPEAQSHVATPIAASSTTVVPMLVRYNGMASQTEGQPKAGATPVTFLVYKDERGGDALWTETQSVHLDATGKFEVYLGSTRTSGLPADLFGSGEARWLEVQVTGEPVQPRTLLVSVPYALHAADAATLGGLPASAFVRAGASAPAALSSPATLVAASSSAVTTPGGTINRIPVFTGATTIANSILYTTPTAIGVGVSPSAYGVLDIGGQAIFRGPLDVARTGNASASTGTNSNPLLFNFQFYNSTTKLVYNPFFSFQAEATGNNTANPAGTMNLVYYIGIGGVPKETGLFFNNDGTIHFAPNQTFPVSSSSGTITGVTAGTGLTGGGTKGTVALSVDSTKIPTLTGNNSLTGSNTFVASLYEATDVNIDSTNRNPGNISPGLRFGIASGEGMSSKRTSGGNQYGLDLYTNYQPRVSINAAGQVAIGTGTQFNGSQLQVQSTSSPAVQGTSTSGPGVLGSTAGGTSNTGGVVGEAGAISGFGGIAGVWGDSSAHVGVLGSSSLDAGVSGTSTNGPGVQGSSTNSYAGKFTGTASATVYSMNSAPLGGSAFFGISTAPQGVGVYATGKGTNGTGVEGVGVGNGVVGDTLGGVLNTAGVLGVAGARTDVAGIAGVWGDAREHVGVIGSSENYSGVYGSSANSFGIQGFSAAASSTANAAGVYGSAGSSTIPDFRGIPIGVWGDTTGANAGGLAVVGTANNAEAGYFTNNSGSPTVFAHNFGSGDGVDNAFRTFEASTSDGTCGFGGKGDLTCTGQVKTLATTGHGSRMVETYSMQSPENWMEDFGSGKLQGGTAVVTIDAAFAETVSGDTDYHVFLTPNGDSKGLYVFAKTPTSFEVRESGGGTSTLAFDYRIVAKRRGLESQRMVDVTEAMKAVKARNDLQAARSGGVAK